jgi:hypothetical protein
MPSTPNVRSRRNSPQPSDSPSSRPMIPRNRSVKALLPTGDESFLSTRGQTLPLLISHLSGSVSNRMLSRHGSFFVGPDDASPYTSGHDIESRRASGEFERPRSTDTHDIPPPFLTRRTSWFGDPVADAVAEERRRTEAAIATLMTPQMRSIRLIGNSNPRYKWYEISKCELH